MYQMTTMNQAKIWVTIKAVWHFSSPWCLRRKAFNLSSAETWQTLRFEWFIYHDALVWSFVHLLLHSFIHWFACLKLERIWILLIHVASNCTSLSAFKMMHKNWVIEMVCQLLQRWGSNLDEEWSLNLCHFWIMVQYLTNWPR